MWAPCVLVCVYLAPVVAIKQNRFILYPFIFCRNVLSAVEGDNCSRSQRPSHRLDWRSEISARVNAIVRRPLCASGLVCDVKRLSCRFKNNEWIDLMLSSIGIFSCFNAILQNNAALLQKLIWHFCWFYLPNRPTFKCHCIRTISVFFLIWLIMTALPHKSCDFCLRFSQQQARVTWALIEKQLMAGAAQ